MLSSLLVAAIIAVAITFPLKALAPWPGSGGVNSALFILAAIRPFRTWSRLQFLGCHFVRETLFVSAPMLPANQNVRLMSVQCRHNNGLTFF